MGYMRIGFTEEQEATVLERLEDIVRRQREEESRRRWTLLLGGIGAVLAAIRLGVIVLPSVRRRIPERDIGRL